MYGPLSSMSIMVGPVGRRPGRSDQEQALSKEGV